MQFKQACKLPAVLLLHNLCGWCAGGEMVIDLQLLLFTLEIHMPDTLPKEAVGANNAYLYKAECKDALGNVGQVL